MAHQLFVAENDTNHERDLFKARLDETIDIAHPLVKVASAMSWDALIDEISEWLLQMPEGKRYCPL